MGHSQEKYASFTVPGRFMTTPGAKRPLLPGRRWPPKGDGRGMAIPQVPREARNDPGTKGLRPHSSSVNARLCEPFIDSFPPGEAMGAPAPVHHDLRKGNGARLCGLPQDIAASVGRGLAPAAAALCAAASECAWACPGGWLSTAAGASRPPYGEGPL